MRSFIGRLLVIGLLVVVVAPAPGLVQLVSHVTTAAQMRRRLRFADLVALGIINNRVTLGNWIRDRDFPPGQLTGPNTRTWGEAEVRAWIGKRPVGPKPIPPLKEGKRRGRPPKALATLTASEVPSG